MAPGAKKKNANKKAGDKIDVTGSRKSFKSSSEEKSFNDCQSSSSHQESDNDSCESKKYNKRIITDNWHKYEETTSDPFTDVMRGKDIEVLISYSGGSGAQLQLQNEKEWEEEISVAEKFMAIDLKELVHVVKCIPFHKQIHLSPNIFSKEQILKFESSAVDWKNSFSTSLKGVIDNKMVKDYKEVSESLGSNLNIIESCEIKGDQEVKPCKSILLEEKTETIIESLASCLSLKDSASENSSEPKKETKIKTENLPDDLDFLLSLNVSLKNPVQTESECKTNVDDWLNSILDD